MSANNKKIFIIEDDANTMASLQAKFSTSGYQVLTHNGVGTIEEVIKVFKETRPAYIILDLMLPQVDGFDLLARVKADGDLTGVPVFVFTNFSDKDTKDRCEELGADHYFVKSDYSFDEFVEKVVKIIDNKENLKK